LGTELCEKTSQNFWRELKKWSAFSLLPPCAGSVQKQDFANNQVLIKNLIFTLFRKTQNAQQRQKKNDENGKNLSFAEFLKNKSEWLVFSSMMKYI